MEIDKTFNFNDPIEATAIFRAPNSSGGANEYGGRILFNWEDIKVVEEYMYPDDWVKYAGPKYFLTLHGSNDNKLILGDYDAVKTYWTMFRNKYSTFPEDILGGLDDDDDND